MPLATEDIIPITRARAQLTELAEDVAKNGRDKILTRNGESYVAIISAADYDRFRARELAAEHDRLTNVLAGVADFANGRAHPWETIAPKLAKLRESIAASRSAY